MKINKAFTLLELLVAIIIVGILGTLSITYMNPSRERVMDREAAANLQIIQAAEKTYRMDVGNYFPAMGSQADIRLINGQLRLVLPAGANRNWNYRVWSNGCSRATRNVAGGRSWFLTINDADGLPNAGAGCP